MAGPRGRDISPAHPIAAASSAHCFLYSASQPVRPLGSIADARTALEAALGYAETSPFLWIEMLSPTDQDLTELATHFGLPDLALEDAAEAHQRPKYEHYGTTDFMVLRPIEAPGARSGRDPGRGVDVHVGELHVFLDDVFIVVISHTDSVDLHAARRTFEHDPRFLEVPQLSALYRVVDEVVDGYAPILGALEDYADTLEERIFEVGPVPPRDVYRLSRELIELDRAVTPLRDILPALQAGLDRRTPPAELLRGVRDVADHAHSAIERLERLRTVAREIFTVNTTLITEQQNDDMRTMNRLAIQQNETMQKISAWAAILFFPTLIAGIYGMNFTHMPEVHWLWGYPFAIGLMLAGSFLLYLVLKHVRWL